MPIKNELAKTSDKKNFHQNKLEVLLQKRICGRKSKQKKAYSLIELAIVITILSILVTGSLVAVSKIYSQEKYNNTNYKIAEIYKALGAYLVANEKLPCPAPITSTKSNDSSYGVSGSCVATTGVYVSGDLVYGMVPVATIGLSKDFAEDGFASKIAYVVNKNFTNSATFGSATYQNIITIKEAAQNSANNQTITNDAIFAIISYGFNKNGSLNTNISDIQTSCISSDDSEQENDIYPNLAAGSTFACATLGSCPSRCPSSTTASFDNILFSSSSSADDFDDIVFYKTRNDLVSDFDALSLIKCPSSSLNITYGASATNFSWQESKYNQITSSSTQCPTGYRSGVQFPTRKCGSYGNWETNLGDSNGLINPCVINASSGGSGTGTCSHNITGTTLKTVNAGSGQLSCDETGYDSTNKIDYTCSDGIFYKTTPAQTCGNCTSNYNTLSDGSCQPISCTVTAPTSAGTTTETVTSASGTLTCDKARYSGTVNYTCVGNQFEVVSGACVADTIIIKFLGNGLWSTNLNNGSTFTSYTATIGTPSSSTNGSSGASELAISYSGGIYSWNLSTTSAVTYLVVGGGGSGGGSYAGGGGGGGVLTGDSSLNSGTYSISVGGGGSGIPFVNRAIGINGGNSSITGTGFSQTAYGGGGGGTSNLAPSAGGGSGGGVGTTDITGLFGGGLGTPGQGNDGARVRATSGGTGNNLGGGGGGGGLWGHGGDGVSNSITKTNTYYAGGGGGRNSYGGAGNGGAGGGGAGGLITGPGGTSGTANTGGGGGGAFGSGSSGAGGSGIVIVRY
jgi:prepilin-type N-terminal cleavage/methylation domain-containing protein